MTMGLWDMVTNNIKQYLVCCINPFVEIQKFFRWNGLEKIKTNDWTSFMGGAKLELVPTTIIKIVKDWKLDAVILTGEKTYIEPIAEELKNNEINVIIGEYRDNELFN